nr:MAG TPA: hypothetical protein [Caudoviricetes sp.]
MYHTSDTDRVLPDLGQIKNPTKTKPFIFMK